MTWEDPGGTDAERAAALLAATEGASRGLVKRLAEALDGDSGLRGAVIALGRRRGADLPAGAEAWPAKRVLRRCRAREADARERTNPIHRDEGFTCVHCGADVPPHGRTARDHCPHCLRSVHVDVVPGDRAAGCGGVLDPVGVEVRGDVAMIRYTCRTCGASRVNRAVRDGSPPDDWEAVIALGSEP